MAASLPRNGTACLLAGLVVGLSVPRAPAADTSPPAPTLVVLIVIDQLRGDYLEIFKDHFVDGGFRRLCGDGAWYTNAYFDHGSTATAPGHATLVAGAPPSVHGIVGNDWFLEAESGRRQYCCGDVREAELGVESPRVGHGRSPRQLRVPTIGDQIKAHHGGRSRVWGIAIKDRAAILTAGLRATGAVWWDSGSGRFVSSTYYGAALPSFARTLNEARSADRFFGTSWTRLLPEAAYVTSRLITAGNRGRSATYDKHHPDEFPKVLGKGMAEPGPAYYSALYASPFGNDLVLEAARRFIEAERLGTDDAVDFLGIGLSSNDVVGHVFGPDSQEVMDCTLRTDRQLARMFEWLDAKVGLSRCLIALSSDHGVGPVVEYSAELGLGGARFDRRRLALLVDERLRHARPDMPAKESFVRGVVFPWLYLNEDVVREAGMSVSEATHIATIAASTYAGVAEAFAAGEISRPQFAGTQGLRRFVQNSLFPGRTGHVYMHWERFWYPGSKMAGHGSAYDYDRHAPVLLFGQGIRPGRYTRPVSPTGLAVTLARLLGVDPPPSATGELFTEALAGIP